MKNGRSPAIQVDLQEAGYQQKSILQAIQLEVSSGEFLAILGENGAGKTTLFRAILQLLPVIKGEIRVFGRPLRSKEDHAWVRSQIGYVPQRQEKGRFPITVFDAVLLGRWGKTFAYFRRPQRADREAVDQMLDKIGLAELCNKDCRALSGGQLQRVNIARALVRDPAILLLDEPTTHLDLEAQSILLESIEHIRHRSDMTILMISHHPEQAKQLADRVITIEAGRLVETRRYER